MSDVMKIVFHMITYEHFIIHFFKINQENVYNVMIYQIHNLYPALQNFNYVRVYCGTYNNM